MNTEFYLKNFKKHQESGINAKREGDMKETRYHFLKAAEYLYRLAQNSDGQIRASRLENAKRLVVMAKSINSNAPSPTEKVTATGDDTGADASKWIVYEKPNVKFNDIAGLEDVKEEIRVRMIYPFTHPDKAKKFGIKKGGGVLLYGPPGTGKTMIAKAIAAELNATFFTVKPSEIMSKWVGEAEQNIKKLFDEAKKYPLSVIFIDEVESLIPKRSDSGSTVMQRVVPQILAELEGFDSEKRNPILFIGATNVPWMLDPAVMRPGRFDVKIYIGLPDKPARQKILELNMANKPLADDVNLDDFSERLEGYSGADIKNICLKAATLPFIESVEANRDRKIELIDILNVLKEIKPSVTPKYLEKYEKFKEQPVG